MPDGHDEQLPGVDSTALALQALYGKAQRQAQMLLQAALESGAIGSAAYREATVARLDALMADLGRKTQGSEGVLADTAYRVAVSAVDLTTDSIHTAGRFKFGGVHVETVNVLAAALEDRLREGRSTVGREARDLFRQVVVEQTAIAAAAGGDRDEPVKRAIADLQAHGVTCFRDRAGRRWSLERYCQMAVRTTAREAATFGTENRMLEAGQDLVTISKHVHPHDICTPLEGRTYSLTGKTAGYTQLPMRPPFHPLCRHVMAPAAANLTAFEAALAQPPEPPPAPTPTGPQVGDRVRSTYPGITGTGEVIEVVQLGKLTSFRVRFDDGRENLIGAEQLTVLPKVEEGGHVQAAADLRADIDAANTDAQLADPAGTLDKVLVLGKTLRKEADKRLAAAQGPIVGQRAQVRKELAKRQRVIDGLQSQIDVLVTEMAAMDVGDPGWDERRAKLTKLQERRNALGFEASELDQQMWELEKQLRQGWHEALQATLEEARPGFGTGVPHNIPKRGAGWRMTQKIAKRFPAEWWEQQDVGSPRKVRIDASSGRRGHYMHSDVDTKTFETVARIRANFERTMLHEWTHRFQYTAPEDPQNLQDDIDTLARRLGRESVDRSTFESTRQLTPRSMRNTLCLVFHQRRTRNQLQARKLAELLPGHGYEANEVTREDEYFHPYVGREYDRYNEPREILTMGMESLWMDYGGRNVAVLDPEHADLMIGLLATA